MSENQKQISICALVLDPYDTSPGQRFRIEQWEPYLKREGILIDYQDGKIASKISELSKATLRRVGHILKASKYDVVFIYRTMSMVGPAFLERILHLRGIPIILDFDDSIFQTNTSNANKRFSWAKFSGKTATICRLSTSVTVGNSYLADYAKKYNDQVFVVPTSIDTNIYQATSKSIKKNECVIVGWTGSSTSQYHLEEFEPVLAQLLEKRGKSVEIRVVSNRQPDFKLLPKSSYSWREWSPQTEVEEISKIDIGIMPTPVDEWAKGKCALKALQYMALGIPAICTDIGANRDVIKHGENGFLATTPEEWLHYFEMLIDNAELRIKLGSAARKTVVEDYSMESCAAIFAQVVRKTVQVKPGSRRIKS
jgi:glycosyltransferase involved in cell wall biosynthesis